MKFLRFFSLIFLMASISVAQNFNGGFNFYLPPDDSSTQKFLPAFPSQPILDFVSTTPDGHFAVEGKPVRFFGVNVVADGAFPAKTKAASIAGRMRKMGFNIARFHHMDNPWSTNSLFTQNFGTRVLNPVALDRMENFIGELKNNGIYANINLHVSRTFRLSDGVVDADSLPEFGKGVTYFDPYLIILQKEFAADLLTHINPYTGLALVDDPVMAMLEVTNENSLYNLWRDGKLKHRSAGGVLSLHYLNGLDSLWHNYLLEQYGTTELLRAAWDSGTNEEAGAELVHNGNFEDIPFSNFWQLELANPAVAVMAKESLNVADGASAAKIRVSAVSGQDWLVQWKQVGFPIKKDSIYTVSFFARSDGSHPISVVIMQDTDPWTMYSWNAFTLSTSWRKYAFTFRAPVSASSNTRMSFQCGAQVGTYWFDDVRMNSASEHGLESNESLEDRNIRRINFGECMLYSDVRVRDMTGFYVKLMQDYFREMKTFLKESLHVKIPIVGTNWNFGPPDLLAQSEMDYIDNHAYWDHPSFPGQPWSSTDWYISNQSMLKNAGGGTIGGLFAGIPIHGKPYTISEYNHPFPNRYHAETPLLITAYSSLHDADGIMFFEYNSQADDWETDMMHNYFSIHRNPAIMSMMPTCALAFRHGYLSASSAPLALEYNLSDVLQTPKNDDRSSWLGLPIVPRTLALQNAVRIKTFNAIESNFSSLPTTAVNPFVSDTREIRWSTAGVLTMASSQFVGITGFLNNVTHEQTGDLRVLMGSDFGSLTWISISGEPLRAAKRSLLTVSSRAQNTGMIWDGTTTIHDDWGHAPTTMQPMTVLLRLHVEADSICLYPLLPNGNHSTSSRMYYPSDTNTFTILIEQNQTRTPWFGIESYGGRLTGVNDDYLQPAQFRLEQNYPNPFNPRTEIIYQIPEISDVSLNVYDVLGQEVATLVNGRREAGKHSILWDSGNLPSGVYFYRIKAVNERGILQFTDTRKLLLTR